MRSANKDLTWQRRVRSWLCILALAVLVAKPSEVEADRYSCVHISSSSVTVEMPPDPYVAKQMEVRIEATREQQAISDPPGARLYFTDCQGNEIPEYTRPLTIDEGWTGHSAVPIDPFVDTIVILPGKYPAALHIDVWGTGACGDPGDSDYSDSIPRPVPDECPGGDGCGTSTVVPSEFISDLEYLACETVEPLADDHLQLSKSKADGGSYVFYTLHASDESAATAGEVVNARVSGLGDGFLIVRITNSGDNLDVYGSACPGDGSLPHGGEGWMVAPNTRNGEKVEHDKCLPMSAGEDYEFNIVAGKGKPPSGFGLSFRYFEWDAENCCVQEFERTLPIRAEELCPEQVDVLRPKRGQTALGGVELRVPACACKGCPGPGNLTPWFVMWPTAPGQEIKNGHAKGWKIVGNKLIGPGPDGLEYEFE